MTAIDWIFPVLLFFVAYLVILGLLKFEERSGDQLPNEPWKK